jgi:hypothetical protein
VLRTSHAGSHHGSPFNVRPLTRLAFVVMAVVLKDWRCWSHALWSWRIEKLGNSVSLASGVSVREVFLDTEAVLVRPSGIPTGSSSFVDSVFAFGGLLPSISFSVRMVGMEGSHSRCLLFRRRAMSSLGPNQSLEPMARSVTSRAAHEPRQPSPWLTI